MITLKQREDLMISMNKIITMISMTLAVSVTHSALAYAF